ncbi:transcriptional regulator, TetR family [Burkholderia sp. GAS332]|nr:transcriptional regulator, TetR family [Burkholderia sp. GAS332]
MKRRRLTREQSTAQRRLRLVCAAQAVFMKKGFVATSDEDIAKAAGHTRGAFYANFGSKQELFLELLQRDHETLPAELHGFCHEEAPREQMEARVLEYFGNLQRDNESLLLWVEAKLLAMRDGRFRACYNTLLQEKLDLLTAYIRQFLMGADTPLHLPAETLAMGLLGLRHGVRLFHMVDPQRVTGEIVEFALSELFMRALLGGRRNSALVHAVWHGWKAV